MIESLNSVSLAQFFDFDSAKTLVLTVNNRYARHIIVDLSARLSEERRVMALPDIMPLSAWLRQAGDELSFVSQVPLAAYSVDAFGAQHLWQHVIAQAESDHALLDVPQAARLAMDADRLLCEWRLQVGPEYETAEYRRFRLWREQYRAHLQALDAEDSNLNYEHVCAAVVNRQFKLAFRTVILAGFNEISPRFSHLIQALQQQGVDVSRLHSEQRQAPNVQRILAPDPDSEWRLAAQWAADSLDKNPQGRYAIVAARLESDVVLAHRTLCAALTTEGAAWPYNVAVARSLADWPLARAALAWLRVISEFSRREYCTPAILGEALLAGGCAADLSESSGRAMIDASWRSKARIKVSNEAFTQLLTQMTPQLALAWQACVNGSSDDNAAATTEVWGQRFRHWLQSLGYPGRPTLDSNAYQVVQALERLFDRLGAQAAVFGNLELNSVVAVLTRLASETPFQPERDPGARLDVLGFLESEGGHWDGIWVLGLTDEVLPAAPKPNPLIPLAALRQANAPRATPDRELQWAHALYAALLSCAPQVWVSHAQREGERQLRPSPCIADLPAVEQAPLQVCPKPGRLEYLQDEQGPPLQTDAGAGRATIGGIGVIDTQSRNPLWAFVKYRLGASELKDYADISDQNARGLLLHRAIELVWRLIADQDALRQLHSAGRLPALIEQAVQQAAEEHLSDYGIVLRALEVARAISVLNGWLSLELTRKPFRVQDVEQSYRWVRGPLELSLRLDRIDELDDGRLAIIDYKSGNASIDPRSDWMRARPIGLQLPFYAAVLAGSDGRVAALVLARLHARKIEVKGLADGDYGFGDLASLGDWPDFSHYTWDGLMSSWRQVIENLADEYSTGVAVNQTLRPNDLEYCDVLPFLRLYQEFDRVD